ncbi:hypothetical protein [Spirosoma fluminis]
MLDGIETDRAAVCDRYLIQRLNIKMPFSPTDGELRYDQPLIPITYKGLHLYGKPRGSYNGQPNTERYWFRVRGSLIKVANQGVHNHDAKDPFEVLYALDDFITYLRLDAFKTPLNGLELSATIPAVNPEQVRSCMVSYLNCRPNFKQISRDGQQLPYAEVDAGQHRLKLYSPITGTLRVEVKIDKMQFLGSKRPQTFADLVLPDYTASLATKLLAAFNKIAWKCPEFNLDSLTVAERELYLQGQLYNYWQVRRQQYASPTEFKRVEKQRSREKQNYNQIVQRYWVEEPPAELQRRLHHQLEHYDGLIHTSLYRTLLDICLERWQYLSNYPLIDRLPNRLRLPNLSEIYPLYFGRFPTIQNAPGKRQLDGSSRWTVNELRRLEKGLNSPVGIHYSPDLLKKMLSAKSLVALSYRDKTLDQLRNSANRPTAITRQLSITRLIEGKIELAARRSTKEKGQAVAGC